MPSPFVKGNKLGKGRPKGCLNKSSQNYLDLQIWAKMIMDGAAELEGKELIEVGFRGLALLFTKIQNIPGAPSDSLANALQMQEALKALEGSKKEAIPEGVPVDSHV